MRVFFYSSLGVGVLALAGFLFLGEAGDIEPVQREAANEELVSDSSPTVQQTEELGRPKIRRPHLLKRIFRRRR